MIDTANIFKMKDHVWMCVFNMFIGCVLLGGADRSIIAISASIHFVGGLYLVQIRPIQPWAIFAYFTVYFAIIIVSIISMSIPDEKSTYICAYICMWLGSLIHTYWLCIHRKMLIGDMYNENSVPLP